MRILVWINRFEVLRNPARFGGDCIYRVSNITATIVEGAVGQPALDPHVEPSVRGVRGKCDIADLYSQVLVKITLLA